MYPVLPDFLRNVFQNNGVRLTNFMSVDDTCLTILTTHTMISRFKKMHPEVDELDLFELCFGSGLATFSIMLDVQEKMGLKVHGVGVEVEPNSIEISKKNAEVLGLENVLILEGSILDKDLLAKIPRINTTKRPTLFVINPPYVPMPDYCPNCSYVNGASDGTYFYESVVFDYLEKLDSPDASLLLSSICDMHKILDKINEQGYKIVDINFCVTPFGRYTSNSTQYICNRVPNNYVCTDLDASRLLYSGNCLQALMGVVISKNYTEEEVIHKEQIISVLQEFKESGLEKLKTHEIINGNIWKLDDYELQEANLRYKR
jgi:hypothetical protein